MSGRFDLYQDDIVPDGRNIQFQMVCHFQQFDRRLAPSHQILKEIFTVLLDIFFHFPLILLADFLFFLFLPDLFR